MLWPKHDHDEGVNVVLSIQIFRTKPVIWIIYVIFAHAVMRSNSSKMRSWGKNGSAIIRRQYQWITSCAIYTWASLSSSYDARWPAFVQWNKQSPCDTLPNTCLVVHQMASSKCYIAKEVSCCSPDGSLEVLHCQWRVLLFASWQPGSVTLPRYLWCNGGRVILRSNKKLINFDTQET